MNPILTYFGVKDVRSIRDSQRFKDEVEPNFFDDVMLSMRGDYLEIIGIHLRDRGPGKVPAHGVYDFAVKGADAGRLVRAAITF